MKAEESGNEFAYRFASDGGVVTEEYLPWSREFVATMGIQLDEDGNEFEEYDSQADLDAAAVEQLIGNSLSLKQSGKGQSRSILRFVSKIILLAIFAAICAAVGSALMR